MNMRTVHVLNALLAVTLLVMSAAAYSALPAQIPTHFGLNGVADSWNDRSLLQWMVLPVVGVMSVALIYAVTGWARRDPSLVNMPGRDEILKLPPEYQQYVLRGVFDALGLLSTLLLVMFSLMQYGAYRTATSGDGSTMITTGALIGLVATPFVLITMMLKTQKRLDTARRLHRAGQPAPG